MKKTLLVDPCTLFLVLKRSAAREAAIARRKRHPGLLHGLFTRPAPHVQREHTARLSTGETIHSNIPS